MLSYALFLLSLWSIPRLAGSANENTQMLLRYFFCIIPCGIILPLALKNAFHISLNGRAGLLRFLAGGLLYLVLLWLSIVVSGKGDLEDYILYPRQFVFGDIRDALYNFPLGFGMCLYSLFLIPRTIGALSAKKSIRLGLAFVLSIFSLCLLLCANGAYYGAYWKNSLILAAWLACCTSLIPSFDLALIVLAVCLGAPSFTFDYTRISWPAPAIGFTFAAAAVVFMVFGVKKGLPRRCP